MTVIRVLLVDDQPLFRRGVRMLIDSQPDLTVVGEASDGEEAVTAATECSPDVVLMDIRMPHVDGIAGTRGIMSAAADASRPAPRVIVLTTFDLDDAALRAIRAGASGFLLKDAEPEFLLAAIRAVHGGHAVVAPARSPTCSATWMPVPRPRVTSPPRAMRPSPPSARASARSSAPSPRVSAMPRLPSASSSVRRR